MHKRWCIFLIKKSLFSFYVLAMKYQLWRLNCAFILYRLNSPAAVLTSCSNQPCVSYICNCRQRKAQNVLLNVCVYLQGPFLISGKKGVLRPCWNAQDANAQLGRPEFLPVLGEFCFHCDLCTEANLLCFCMVWLHLKSAAQSWLHR